MQNTNEFRDGDKLYIKKIKSCECTMKIGECYLLECDIHQRGIHSYDFRPEFDRIARCSFANSLWLSEDAKNSVKKAVDKLECQIKEAEGKYTKASFPKIGLTVFYRRTGKDSFNYVSKKKYDMPVTYRAYKKCSANFILDDISQYAHLCCTGLNREAVKEYVIDRPTDETIYNNPFYKSAVDTDDEVLQKLIKVYYKLARKHDYSWLSKMLGKRFLPALPKEYDKEYYVDADTIDIGILSRSGYVILHRPYFAMKDSTHDTVTLNPHTKQGSDAAKVDCKAISFTDYLALFDQAN